MTTNVDSVADTISAEIKSINEQIAEHETQAIALREKLLGFEICSAREQLFPTRSRFMTRDYNHPGPDFEHIRGANPHLTRIQTAASEWNARIKQIITDAATSA